MTISTFKIANKLITGDGATSELRNETARLGITKPLIVTDHIIQQTGMLDQIQKNLEGLTVGVFLGVKPEPEFYVVEECRQMFHEGDHDGLIAIGGGSAIDTAKAVSAYAKYEGALTDLVGTDRVEEKGYPLIVIPTTAGTGSEVTNISILSDKKEQVKKGVVSDYLLPDVAIVSPEMTLTMPAGVTAASGIDALVHAIEAYISVHASPITDALAIGAMKMIAVNLPKAYANPNNVEAREQMATASLMAGMAFGNAGVGAVHALAYPLGGRFNIPHGVSNALLLPYVMEWNKIACLERFRDVAAALGEKVDDATDNEAAEKAIKAMSRLCKAVRIPDGLKELGIKESDLDGMAEDASKIDRLLKNNPRLLHKADILEIYQAAYKGGESHALEK
ncbi:iron-containing alcohol dehydrogenase [Domibacillus sp. DTU_2020_1001157_1_SI_ALB_TIR_016]|uniref:iron-containing alcohol dehydrogenase n=1 Tax=Domibacillus sp. DTU_2020_1001157_1_SI_ALB_TIR_016 TaxID=3077789 RepID=UPI0028EB83B9|nr:iron-containing alcohol dehydrogenase [Domibacillus sp. DTU_2020_1001157_1_SI_ALB_TIR_016]WNS77859.1 iron-containing alcohol dehydrogenase [Domibacillus sp. DTU_2020_1001157_1_SI_ALB_TIR_016]